MSKSVSYTHLITGVGETVKAWTNDVRIVAVEPYESQALSSGLTGSHGIPDIGFGLVPGNYNSYVCLLYTSGSPAAWRGRPPA